MSYTSLEECLLDLEKRGELLRIREEVDPYLEMAALHLQVHEQKGPALLFERVKGSRYRCASNLFGTLDRSRYIFRDTLQLVQDLIEIRQDPVRALKSPIKNFRAGLAGLHALPRKKNPDGFEEIRISDLPQIHHWPQDGGPFVTLPQVYTEDPDQPGIMKANLGMYRIQLGGNDYVQDKEIGLHYQLHRGIGIHQTRAQQKGMPLKVSCFTGGPPAHTVAAVMPLPEGLSEMTFAGVLGGRRFRYGYKDGFCLSADADFVITGEVLPGEVRPEGPFGDHLGYYSLKHPFPLMRVHKVFARKNAIWPFTVVGRPPQEDTRFGELIHEMTGGAIKYEIPGLREVHAVDASGVHPLLLAIGSERYTPYLNERRPAEILTLANRVLGTGQLSLAKFLFITADDESLLHTHNVEAYLFHIWQRIDLTRDLHFHTRTTIDTLDYSGEGLNSGSKVVLAAYGDVKREPARQVPPCLSERGARLVMPGVVAMSMGRFQDYRSASSEMEALSAQLETDLAALQSVALIVLCDDADFVSAHLNNFLWVTFTRSNPSHDIYGVASFTEHKHWGCRGPLLIDARVKPHHAPALERDPVVERRAAEILHRAGWKG